MAKTAYSVIAVVVGLSMFSVTDQTCTNCSCNFNGVCDHCNIGFYGEECQLACPSACRGYVCDRSSGVCTNCTDEWSGNNCCLDGFYDYTCNKRCPSNCTVCYLLEYQDSKEPYCTACIDGHFNSKCLACPGRCLSGVCDFNTGNCVGTDSCEVGFYGEYCEKPCPNYCRNKTCSRTTGECNDGCQDGYRGADCQITCPGNCSQNQCQQFGDANCLYGCMDGYYDPVCSTKCPGRCLQNKCEQSDPLCTLGCDDGYFTDYCTNSCSSVGNCARNKCNHEDGRCDEGCADGYFGAFCTFLCSSNCKYGICDQVNQKCKFGCGDSSYFGDTCRCPLNCNCLNHSSCDSCKTGFYQEEKQCTCNVNDCNDSTCSKCTNPQFYPDNGTCCQCNKRCKGGLCTLESQCSSGCENGFFGPDCSALCSQADAQCEQCEETVTGTGKISCSKCKNGFYPDMSGVCIECRENCLNKSCDSITGYCTSGCVEGFWSQTCERSCHEDCSSCQADYGECLSCKNRTQYGYNCQLSCSENCNNTKCHIETGHCTEGCVENHFGVICENKCPESCKEPESGSTCHSSNGQCLNGCEEGHFGEFCSHHCSALCKRSLCYRADGVCVEGCIDGYRFMNDSCIEVDQTSEPTSSKVVIAASVSSVAAVVTMVTVAYIVFRRRIQRKCASKPIEETVDSKINGLQTMTGSPSEDYTEIETAYDKIIDLDSCYLTPVDNHAENKTDPYNKIHGNENLEI